MSHDYTFLYLALLVLAVFAVIMLDIMKMDKELYAAHKAWKLRDKAHFAHSQNRGLV